MHHFHPQKGFVNAGPQRAVHDGYKMRVLLWAAPPAGTVKGEPFATQTWGVP